MKVLNPEIDLLSFFLSIKNASHKALFLDYDGTLAPFHVDPGEAYPYPEVRPLLENIVLRPDIRLVIISGRRIHDLKRLLNLDPLPELWGSHGLERRRKDGAYEVASMDEDALTALVNADKWIEKKGLTGQCEKKPGCLAVHWRGLSREKQTQIRRLFETEWKDMAGADCLLLNEFDGGLEIRVPGPDKGDAASMLLAEMEKDTVVAYLGDDFTDEDAFRAIKGRGLGVLVRGTFRSTSADIWLTPPQELLEFLSRW